MAEPHRNSNRGITIPGVIKDMRIEPDPKLAWSVGAKVRDLYLKTHGQEPPKELRPKTSGSGSHCFAIYPESMRQTIEEVVADHQTQAARQGDLF